MEGRMGLRRKGRLQEKGGRMEERKDKKKSVREGKQERKNGRKEVEKDKRKIKK